MTKKPLGTIAGSPASPPVLPSGRAVAATLERLVNLVEGTISAAPKLTCLPLPRRDMPAGFHHTVLASSATAAPPEYALPRPLMPCSCSANAEALASDALKRPSAEATAQA